MTNNSEPLDPKKIIRFLAQSTGQLDEATLSALANARRLALERQSVRASVFTFVPASLQTSLGWTNKLIPHSVQQWVTAGLLVAAVAAGTGYWQHIEEQQIDELDVAILTDDLPIEVFVD